MKLKLFIATSLFLLSIAVQAQQEFPSSPQLSEKHKKKLEKISDPEKKLRKYKKWFRQDSIRWEKERRKLEKSKNDNSSFTSVKSKISKTIDSSSVADSLSLTDVDSTTLVNEITGDYSSEVTELLKADSSSVNLLKEKASEEVVKNFSETDAISDYSKDATILLKADSTTVDLAKEKAGEELMNQVKNSESFGEYSDDIPTLLKADSSSAKLLKKKGTDEIVSELKNSEISGEYGNELTGLIQGDSLSSELITSKAQHEILNQTGIAVDTAELRNMFASDSAFIESSFKILKDSLSNSNRFGEQAIYLEDVKQLKDSASLEYVGKRTEEELSKKLSEREEIKSLADPSNKLGGIEELHESPDELLQTSQEEVQNLANAEMSEHMEQITAAQGELASLKNKYSSVLNSNDLSTAVKRNSLSDKNVLQRLIFSGNFQIQSYQPLILDASPTLGYAVNKLFHLGVGFHWRYTFKDSTNLNIPVSNIGYKAYASHDLFKNFFGYMEYEKQQINELNPTTDVKEYVWKEAWHIGIGRTISINNLINVQILALYNLLHDPVNPIYSRPWNVRVGVQVKSEKIFGGKKREGSRQISIEE